MRAPLIGRLLVLTKKDQSNSRKNYPKLEGKGPKSTLKTCAMGLRDSLQLGAGHNRLDSAPTPTTYWLTRAEDCNLQLPSCKCSQSASPMILPDVVVVVVSVFLW